MEETLCVYLNEGKIARISIEKLCRFLCTHVACHCPKEWLVCRKVNLQSLVS